jgi:hypothetical protein
LRGSHERRAGFLKSRPALSVTIAGALAAIALLIIPIPYERTTGHDVALALSGAKLDQGRVREIARELKSALHVDHVMVHASDVNGVMSFDLSTTVPTSAGVNAVAAANAFGAELGKLGLTASAHVSAVKEPVIGTVYAYARDRVIEINMDGKSAAQIESEIRQRLAEAGIIHALVSVTDVGSNYRKVTVKMHEMKSASGSQPLGHVEEAVPELVLKKNGQSLGGQGVMIRVEKRKTADGTTLILHVQQNEKSATVEVPHVESLSDATLASQIESQLKSVGIEATAKVTNGEIEIQQKQ